MFNYFTGKIEAFDVEMGNNSSSERRVRFSLCLNDTIITTSTATINRLKHTTLPPSNESTTNWVYEVIVSGTKTCYDDLSCYKTL